MGATLVDGIPGVCTRILCTFADCTGTITFQASAARHVYLLERPSVIVQPSRQRSGAQHKKHKLRWRALGRKMVGHRSNAK
ncbi:MAG: hypothetical protein DMF05_06425 [Verrucomicrobia bacterium]|nr:MAG: hypothetical protein DMF05_06425 [Verrucomicrobiota bacterium]